MTVEQTTVDPAKVEATIGKVVEELGVALGTLTATLGWRAGLWQALAGAGPLTPTELAGRAGTAEAYAREWLKAQAAGGWVAYDPASGRFTLPDEVAAALVGGPGGAILDACVTMMLAMGADFPRYVEAFRAGRGSAGRRSRPSTWTAPTRSAGSRSGPSRWRRSWPAWTGPGRGWRGAGGSPTSAAAAARRRSPWRRPARTPGLTVSTPTTARSRGPAGRRPPPA
jgi:hypothetical protein